MASAASRLCLQFGSEATLYDATWIAFTLYERSFNVRVCALLVYHDFLGSNPVCVCIGFCWCTWRSRRWHPPLMGHHNWKRERGSNDRLIYGARRGASWRTQSIMVQLNGACFGMVNANICLKRWFYRAMLFYLPNIWLIIEVRKFLSYASPQRQVL